MKALGVVLTALLLMLQYRLWVGEGSLAEVSRLKQAITQQRHENATLRERNDLLDAEVTDLKDGMEAVEERARRDLGMIGRNETFFQIVDE